MLRARPASREDEPDILSRLPTSILEDRIAGISANSKALTTETPSVNVSTAVFSPTLANRGMSFGPKRTIPRSAQCASSRLAAPAHIASIKLSVKIWRTILRRPAPRARRMAISR